MTIAIVIGLLNILAIVLPFLIERSKDTPEKRDKEVDNAMSGSNEDVGMRLHRLVDRLRRRKDPPGK